MCKKEKSYINEMQSLYPDSWMGMWRDIFGMLSVDCLVPLWEYMGFNTSIINDRKKIMVAAKEAYSAVMGKAERPAEVVFHEERFLEIINCFLITIDDLSNDLLSWIVNVYCISINNDDDAYEKIIDLYRQITECGDPYDLKTVLDSKYQLFLNLLESKFIETEYRDAMEKVNASVLTDWDKYIELHQGKFGDVTFSADLILTRVSLISFWTEINSHFDRNEVKVIQEAYNSKSAILKRQKDAAK